MRSIGRYRLDEVVGSGAFATVWRGHDGELEIEVAVKVLAENWSHHADVRERFLEEARILRRVADPRVVRVYDVGVHEGQPYFVMDHAEGGTLADRADGTLPLDEALRLAAEAARAVQVLHDHGLVHRDVKPHNLLVRQGHVLVADLGSAKRLAEASGITVTTGTPAYMAPEQAAGRPLSERSDVYALGILAAVLVTGTLPYPVDDPMALLQRSAGDRPASTAGRDDLPAPTARALDEVLRRATALDPARRHGGAAELAEDLEAVAAGLPTSSAGSHPVRPALLGVLALGVFLAVMLGTWVLLGLR